MAATVEASFAKRQTACADTEARFIAADAKLEVALNPYIENKTSMRVEQLISVMQQMTATNYGGKIIELQQLIGTLKTSTQQVVGEAMSTPQRTESSVLQLSVALADLGDKSKGIEIKSNNMNGHMPRDKSMYWIITAGRRLAESCNND